MNNVDYNGRVNIAQVDMKKQFSLYDKIPVKETTSFSNALQGNWENSVLSIAGGNSSCSITTNVYAYNSGYSCDTAFQINPTGSTTLTGNINIIPSQIKVASLSIGGNTKICYISSTPNAWSTGGNMIFKGGECLKPVKIKKN